MICKDVEDLAGGERGGVGLYLDAGFSPYWQVCVVSE